MTAPTVTRRPRDPGLRIHHDIRNERWLLRDALPIRRALGAAAAAPVVQPFVPRTVHHRQYRRYDQTGPSCTGFAPVTLCAAAHPFQPPPISGLEWYELNRKRDREEMGLDFPEGATVASSLEVGRKLGVFSAYRWAYEIETMQRAIVDGPLIVGTLWPVAMFERDAEGIVRKPTATEWQWAGGHEYVLGAYDARRDLWDVEQTWAPFDEEKSMPYSGWVYRIPGDLMHELIRRDGECAQIDEVRLAKE